MLLFHHMAGIACVKMEKLVEEESTSVYRITEKFPVEAAYAVV